MKYEKTLMSERKDTKEGLFFVVAVCKAEIAKYYDK